MPKYPYLLIGCSASIAVTVFAAAPLGAIGPALIVGATSAAFGAAFGLLLAGVTRVRAPLLIYALLLAAALGLAPVIFAWPPAGEWQIHPWSHAPALVLNYFDVVRPIQFFVAMVWPFAAFGHHAADELPTPP